MGVWEERRDGGRDGWMDGLRDGWKGTNNIVVIIILNGSEHGHLCSN